MYIILFFNIFLKNLKMYLCRFFKFLDIHRVFSFIPVSFPLADLIPFICSTFRSLSFRSLSFRLNNSNIQNIMLRSEVCKLKEKILINNISVLIRFSVFVRGSVSRWDAKHIWDLARNVICVMV
jgi:hypothetical protein